jgi:hypothetical protein
MLVVLAIPEGLFGGRLGGHLRGFPRKHAASAAPAAWPRRPVFHSKQEMLQ